MLLPRPSLAALSLPITALAFCAALFGGNWPFAQILTTLLLAASALSPIPSQPFPPLIRYGILLPIALTLGWAAIQTIPAPFLPTHPVFSLVNSPWIAISLNPTQSWNHLAYAIALLLCALTLFHLNQATNLRLAVAIITTITALYGIFIFATGNQALLWLPKTAYVHDLTATFINRNSYATFCGLGILACLSILLNRVGEISSRLTPRQRLKAGWLLILRPKWPVLIPLFLLFTALILTHSRAGIICTFLGITTMLLALLWARPPARLILTITLTLFTTIAFTTLSIIGTPLADRFTTLPADQSTRHTLYTLTQQAIVQAPLTGQGLGSFPQAFNLIRTPSSLTQLPGQAEHAHNTYLELATELGLPALALLLIVLATTTFILLRGLTLRRRAVIWPATGLGALTLTATHALVDFSLSIPAVLLASMLLIVPALAQSFRPPEDSTPTRNPTIRILAILTTTFALWQTWALYPTLTHNYALSLHRNPFNAEAWRNLATTNLTLAAQTTNPGLQTLYQTAAAQAFTHALQLNPADATNWYRLALITHNQTALINSILTGPFNPGLATLRHPLEQQALATATPDNAILLRTHLNQLQAARAKPLGAAAQTR